MNDRIAEIRYTLRSLIDQIIGFCDVSAQQGESLPPQLVAGVRDIGQIAASIAASLDTPDLNGRQLENVGRRVLTLMGHVGQRSADLMALADRQGHVDLSTDLKRLGGIAESLMPFAKELILNHDALAIRGPAPSTPPFLPAGPASATLVPNSNAPLLIVDDNAGNREVLARRLARLGHSSVMVATGGREALALLAQHEIDLVLLDMMMPDLDGVAVLRAMKQDPRLRDIPVVMISAVDEVASVAQCLELGAEDYLPKPFNKTILRARIQGSLERKRLRDEDKRQTRELEQALNEIDKARRTADALLRNILPSAVAEELQEKGSVEPMYFEDVTIVFTDFVGFTAATEAMSADELVTLLHGYFTGMDHVVERCGVEKLKTIGDSYMLVAGLPVRNPAHPVDAVLAAFEILDFVSEMRTSGKGDWRMRIGIHTGPVIAGVVGVQKFAFDIWGESVNMASRMESSGAPDQLNLSESTYSRVKDFFLCEHRGKVRTKDGDDVDMYTALSAQPKLLAEPGDPPSAFARRYRTYFRKDLQHFPASLRKTLPPEAV